MKRIIPICIVGILLCTAIGAVAQTNDTEKTTQQGSSRSATHTVFAEDCTAHWCPHCPYASEALKNLYNGGWHDFYFTTLIDDKNVNCAPREDEYNLYGFPTVFFDGGYNVQCGAYDNTHQMMGIYNSSLTQCANRAVPNIVTTISVNWLGDARMDIQVSVNNNDATPYAGRIRVYVTEVLSSMGWLDYIGNKYPYPFLDYAFNEPISIAPSETWSDSTTWNGYDHNDGYGHNFGSIQYGNIMVMAAVFNNTWVQKYAYPPSSNPFHAFYVDDAAGFLVGNNGPYMPSNPNPANGATSVDINKDLSWTGGGTPGLTITYDVYFGTASTPPKVSSNQSGTTYNPGTLSYSTKYYWKIVAWDEADNHSEGPIWTFTTINNPNSPPVPTITGPEKGSPGKTYKYTITGTDPDTGDTVSAYIEWGDNSTTDWTAFHTSGEAFYVTHTWAEKGTYTVQVKVKDEHGAESDWATLDVKMPTSFEITNPFMHWLFEMFPNAFPLLRQLLGV